MLTKVFPLVLFPLMVISPVLEAQESSVADAKAAMARLEFMVGRWEGSSSMRMGPGAPVEARGTEDVQWRLGGLALLVEGEFFGVDSPAGAPPVHQALGIITYDGATGDYRFDAHTAEGQSVTARGTLREGVFEWGPPKTPRGFVRYRLTLDSEGRWHEVGEGSSDGTTWYPFFEMTLERTK